MSILINRAFFLLFIPIVVFFHKWYVDVDLPNIYPALGVISLLYIIFEFLIIRRLDVAVVNVAASADQDVVATSAGIAIGSKALQCMRLPFVCRLLTCWVIQFGILSIDPVIYSESAQKIDHISPEITDKTGLRTKKPQQEETPKPKKETPKPKKETPKPLDETFPPEEEKPKPKVDELVTTVQPKPGDSNYDEDYDPNIYEQVIWKPESGSENVNLKRTLQSMSVVLPCAGEGMYAYKTARSVIESMNDSDGKLLEIVIVDDGSDPPLSKQFLNKQYLEDNGYDSKVLDMVKIVRHEEAKGLMGAKQAGGDVAKGDMIVFFDCHVAPQTGWWKNFFRGISDNYRRIMIPQITGLDVDTWTQERSGGVAKCYVTFDGDFKWVDSDNDDVPILSGGLLGLSREWWLETEGYDPEMHGWGGENIDQSMRTWLCGGEMTMAVGSEVAHMWRKGDSKTRAHYKTPPGSKDKNLMRATMGWFGDFGKKILTDYPMGQSIEYGDLSVYTNLKKKLNCKPFSWFIWRFKTIYVDGGMLPENTFRFQQDEKCLQYMGRVGTSPDGWGKIKLQECDSKNDRQRFHAGNKARAGLWFDSGDTEKFSGLRCWNTDQCLLDVKGSGEMGTGVCNVAGLNAQQVWHHDKNEKIVINNDKCLSNNNGDLVAVKCENAKIWKKIDIVIPSEKKYYEHALRTQPNLFPKDSEEDIGTQRHPEA